MITMDFDTFIENFHKRLAQRLTEFDKALTEAQKTVDAAREKQAKNQSRTQAHTTANTPAHSPLGAPQSAPQSAPQGATLDTPGMTTPPAARPRRGAVQGVLRKN